MNNKNQSIIFKGFIIFALVLSVMFSAPSLFDGSVFAVAQETCPDDGDWDKVDGLTGESYTYDAPEGKLIAEWCYKAGNTVNYGDVDPNSSSVTITSTVLNPQEECCQDLSHASFRLVDDEKKEVLDPLTLTGECLGEQLILLNAATIKWTVTNPNDESIAFSWSSNNGESGNGTVPANDSTTFTTDGDSYKVTLTYDLNESSTQTELEIEVCETKEEPGTLTFIGECIGDGTIKWTVSNNNENAIDFTWTANNGDNGAGQVPGNDSTSFITSEAAFSITLAYSLDQQPFEVDAEVEACSEKEEPEDPKPEDPQPDQPAGGVGPSTINPTTFFLIGLAGLGMVSAFFFKKVNITK